MQYIKKQSTEPADWNNWFTVPPLRRTFDYDADYAALPNLSFAKAYLIAEQCGLCAYCQQKIEVDNASIEHVTPKKHNKELSTSYFNLVAVCKKNQVKDPPTGLFHCDSTRGNLLMTPIIFYSNAQSIPDRINKFFIAYASGEIGAKPNLQIEIKKQVEAFLEILNLNHSILKANRAKDTLRGLIAGYASLPVGSHDRNIFGEHNTIEFYVIKPFLFENTF
ncbi:MAG: TIGR02646 family protein [Bacteroidetes bacterium]|nr:TIGR02646 family protein [Bacteroidota bacterium]